MKYMKIKQAKNTIIYEVAKNGFVTSKSFRIFIEHRISKETFDELVRIGKEKHKTTSTNS